jgi:hypothetical protein
MYASSLRLNSCVPRRARTMPIGAKTVLQSTGSLPISAKEKHVCSRRADLYGSRMGKTTRISLNGLRWWSLGWNQPSSHRRRL